MKSIPLEKFSDSSASINYEITNILDDDAKLISIFKESLSKLNACESSYLKSLFCTAIEKSTNCRYRHGIRRFDHTEEELEKVVIENWVTEVGYYCINIADLTYNDTHYLCLEVGDRYNNDDIMIIPNISYSDFLSDCYSEDELFLSISRYIPDSERRYYSSKPKILEELEHSCINLIIGIYNNDITCSYQDDTIGEDYRDINYDAPSIVERLYEEFDGSMLDRNLFYTFFGPLYIIFEQTPEGKFELLYYGEEEMLIGDYKGIDTKKYINFLDLCRYDNSDDFIKMLNSQILLANINGKESFCIVEPFDKKLDRQELSSYWILFVLDDYYNDNENFFVFHIDEIEDENIKNAIDSYNERLIFTDTEKYKTLF